MITTPAAKSPPTPTPKPRYRQLAVISALLLLPGLLFWPVSELPRYHAVTSHPVDWTPGGQRWDRGWHEVEVNALDETVCRLFATLPPAVGKVLIASQLSGQGEQLGLYNIATGALEAQSGILPPLTEQFFRDGVLLQIPPRTLGWPVVFIVDPLTLKPMRELALSGDASLLDKLPTDLHFLDAMLTLEGELRAIIMVSPQPDLRQPARWYWLAADATGRVQELRQCPQGLEVVHAWPNEHPTTLLFATDLSNPTPTLAVNYETGEPIPIPPDAPAVLTARVQDHRDRPRTVPLAQGRLPLRLTDGARFTPYLTVELSIPRRFIPNEFAPDLEGLTWRDQLPFTWERMRYEAWKVRHTPQEIAMTAAQSLTFDAMTLITDAENQSVRELNGDFLTSAGIELAYSLTQADYAVHALVHPTYNPLQHDQQEQFTLYNEYLRGLQVWPLSQGRVLILQSILAPNSVPDAPLGLMRIGILPVVATQVQWLGYVAMPSYFDIAPEHAPFFVQLRRNGAQLLCSFGGHHQAAEGEEPDSHFDLYWTAFPLPPELADLPEGIVQ